ncbi:uncharacterized protein LOC134765908 [Penaeus indicus]|uniref:uncharacterized protein LOC134765908 n=1 Tax=Penaeus indicus TaxID=29960 RepID=UPI00300CB915
MTPTAAHATQGAPALRLVILVVCAATINGQQAIPGVFQLGDAETTFVDAAQMFGFANFESLKITSGEARADSARTAVLPPRDGDFAAAKSERPTHDPIDDIIAGKVAGHNDSVNVVPETGSDRSHAPISSEADKKSRSDLKSAPPGAAGRQVDKRVLARIMREQFNEFKQRLTRKAKSLSLSGQQADGFKSEAVMDAAAMSAKDRPSAGAPAVPPSRVLVGEVVPKAARRAGEEPSGVRSGLLRQDAHPIPVTFTSLPGFPSVPRASGTGVASVATGATDQASAGPSASPAGGRGRAPSVMIDSLFGGGERGSGIRGAGFSRVPGVPGPRRLPGVRGTTTTRTSSSPPDLMSILQTRLIGGVRSVPSGASGGAPATVTGGGGVLMAGDSMLLQFDPSIVVNFLTLVALTQQQQRRGGGEGSPQGQRNASPAGGPTIAVASPASDGEFGPFSDGADPSAGVDPSTILLPPMLRQTLYSYLLPRLASLSALVETVPGVPGLDYPIIGTVPYTNFYCSNMPWPGFYADTEARCQSWHYCDLDGRQASFLCPNGTVFNQAFFVCDWWYNFDCESAPYLYSLNERVFALPEVDETAPHRTLTAEMLETIFL